MASRDVLKKFELAFRGFLMRILGGLVHRRRIPVPENLDFNRSKVLFIRQDRIGDVLVSTPLFSSLKRKYPGMRIDVLLSRNNFFVLDRDTTVSKRWVYTKELLSTIRVLRGIRAEHYDFVVDLMDNPSATSTVAMLLSGGKWNVGLEKENAFAYDIVVPMLSRRESHIVDRLAKLLEAFGMKANSGDLRIRYSVSEEAERTVDQFLANREKHLPIVGVNISAGNDARFWGIDNYRNLLGLLMQHRPNVQVLVLSKPSDRSRAKEIIAEHSKVMMAPETSFDEFAAFISRVQLLLTPDTSAVHIAAAFGIPSVILYVQSDSNLRIWEPFNTDCEAIIAKVDDLSTITVQDVFDAFIRLQARLIPQNISRTQTSHQRA